MKKNETESSSSTTTTATTSSEVANVTILLTNTTTISPEVTILNGTTVTSLASNITEAVNRTEESETTTPPQSPAKPVLDPQAKEDLTGNDSMYGYKGEVVLICFTVVFFILFTMMVVKYHRLKTRFGGYEVEPHQTGPAGGGRNNPSYDLQMSYRHGDE